MQLLKKKKQMKSLVATIKAVIVLSVALLMLGAVFYMNSKFETNRGETDKLTFCRSGNIPEIVAVIVDHTDKFTPVQHEALRRYLRDTALDVKKNGMVQLYGVDNTTNSVLQPRFFLCNPGGEYDLENMLARRASTVRKNYEESFVKKLNTVLEELLVAKSSQQSPIMQSIQSVAVTAFKGKDRQAAKKTLIIVSDLLQYTPGLSLYKDVPDFETFKKNRLWQNIRMDLRGVTVSVLYVRRDKGQSQDLLLFWQKYFEEQGATFQAPELM